MGVLKTSLCVPTFGSNSDLNFHKFFPGQPQILTRGSLFTATVQCKKHNIINAIKPTPKKYSTLYKVLITKRQQSRFSKDFFP